MKNTVIAIRFSDNDFYNTFYGVLKTLQTASDWVGNETLFASKENLVLVINEISTGIYMSFQNEFRYSNGRSMSEHILYIKEYLKITEANILIGEEVDTYVKENKQVANSEVYIIDFRIQDNNNMIYSF